MATDRHDALPLRLSVARGGVGIELSAPVELPGLVVEGLEVALPQLRFPVDLSKGVKQFRNRRGVLSRAEVRLDLVALAERWAEAAGDILGEPVLGARATAGLLEGPAESSADNLLGANDGGADDLAVISVSLHGEQAALAFDLVLTSGRQPGWIVDAARGIDLPEAPMAMALRLVDRGIAALPVPTGDLQRSGRVLALNGLARFLCVEVLSRLGCRVPEVRDQVMHRARFERGDIRLTLDPGEAPAAVSARAIRLAGLADLTYEADDALASGDFSRARALFMDALSGAPGHAVLLRSLAEIDAFAGGRAESALSFLDEAKEVTSEDRAASELLRARVLKDGIRAESHKEALRAALEAETDAVLGALLACRLAELEDDDSRVAEYLDAAVVRAPFLLAPRWMRIVTALQRGDLTTAEADAAHVEASSDTPEQRVTRFRRLGLLMGRAGHQKLSVMWLRRALRASPDDHVTKLKLAGALSKAGQALPAAELLQSLLRTRSSPDSGVKALEPAELERARLMLAEILANDVGDIPLALSVSRDIDSRADTGLSARRLEIELAKRAGDERARRRAVGRLLEAIELRWVTPAQPLLLLEEIALFESKSGAADLAGFARRLASSIADAAGD